MALLKIKQIESLESELASKSDTGHVHAASDITSGEFALGRIPVLSLGKIPVLTSGKIPNLSAAKITTGTMSQSRISGLVANVDDFESRIAVLESAGGTLPTLDVDGMGASDVSAFLYDTGTNQLIIVSDAGNLRLDAGFISYP